MDHQTTALDQESSASDGNTNGEINLYDIPWLFRRLPGRTGNMLGHLIPASMFLAICSFMLILSVKRARNIKSPDLAQRFSELHIPERSQILQRRMGKFLMISTSVGFLFEGLNGLAYWNFFHFLAHQGLYYSFFVPGLCLYLESRRLIPLDTYRLGFAIAFLSGSVGWMTHAHMKELAADKVLHEYLSCINLLQGLVALYSIGNTKSVLAYVSMWAIGILQGAWLLTAGSYECCYDVSPHNLPGILAFETCTIFLVLLLGAVALVPNLAGADDATHESVSRGAYSTIELSMNENDEDRDPLVV